ncbi:MAG: phosphatidylserine/phosphatidylglycerophosphate/cardiolipin synthase family protein [Candidatus Schekmanbacteria bacterium]|nr:phosphatidylserine/phosphatidylglycerophosphate/cardiolipin synthase family protein [Candidatus Schekmanbacteria bacterium]
MRCICYPVIGGLAALAASTLLAGCVGVGPVVIAGGEAPLDLAAFAPTIESIAGAPPTTGNDVTIVASGPETFSRLLALLQSARRSIEIETYLFHDDATGRRVAQVLARKAEDGVSVRLLVDAVGSRGWRSSLARAMRASGVRVCRFNPLRPWRPGQVSHRMHRKIIVVDGRVAMTGGFGIADLWAGSGTSPPRHRDLQVVVQGPIVAALARGFREDWFFYAGEVIPVGGARQHRPAASGASACQVVLSTPRSGRSHSQAAFLLLLAGASRSFWMEVGYFTPDPQSLAAILAAARRGVDIRFVVSSPANCVVCGPAHAGRRVYPELLDAGVAIYEYEAAALHAKFGVVDRTIATVGSTNLDARSFGGNDEANIFIQGDEVVGQLEAILVADMGKSRRIDRRWFADRPFRARLTEWLFGLVAGAL